MKAVQLAPTQSFRAIEAAEVQAVFALVKNFGHKAGLPENN